jgi:hypothetical protein
MLAMNAKFSSANLCRANGEISDAAIATLEKQLPRLPFQELHWPCYPTVLYGDNRVVVEVDGETWVWVTARDADAFRTIAGRLEDAGVQWEHYALQSSPTR